MNAFTNYRPNEIFDMFANGNTYLMVFRDEIDNSVFIASFTVTGDTVSDLTMVYRIENENSNFFNQPVTNIVGGKFIDASNVMILGYSSKIRSYSGMCNNNWIDLYDKGQNIGFLSMHNPTYGTEICLEKIAYTSVTFTGGSPFPTFAVDANNMW